MPDTAHAATASTMLDTDFEAAMRIKTAIVTQSGRTFDLARPDPAAVNIADIAAALSRIPRFGGQTRDGPAYSVAQHSAVVAAILAGMDEHPLTCLCGLLHDAHEAYMGDVTTPMKRAVPGLSDFEDTLQRCVAQAFDLPWPFPDSVAAADAAAFRWEAAHLMPGAPEGWRHRPNALSAATMGPDEPLKPDLAKALFMGFFASTIAVLNGKRAGAGR